MGRFSDVVRGYKYSLRLDPHLYLFQYCVDMRHIQYQDETLAASPFPFPLPLLVLNCAFTNGKSNLLPHPFSIAQSYARIET